MSTKGVKVESSRGFVSQEFTVASGAKAPRLPITALHSIAAFSANPPAIYAFCLTSAYLHGRCGEEVTATTLLKVALQSSFQQLLRVRHLPNLANCLAALRRSDGVPQAIIGSTMVQVALGESWGDSDIDIFCTTSAVKSVIGHVKDAGFVQVEDDDSEDYDSTAQEEPLAPRLLDTKIGYVEHWKRDADMDDSASDASVDSESSTALKGGVDIVVAQGGCSDARKLLHSFDIIICAISYDGLRFHVPHPHLTFKQHSLIEQRRLAIMQGFAQGNLSDLKALTLEADSFEMALHSQCWASFIRGSLGAVAPWMTMMPIGPCISHPNYFYLIKRLFERHQKYKHRGIVLVDAPRRCGRITKLLNKLERKRRWRSFSSTYE